MAVPTEVGAVASLQVQAAATVGLITEATQQETNAKKRQPGQRQRYNMFWEKLNEVSFILLSTRGYRATKIS